MRNAFIQELIEQARIHRNIFLVVGDLGYDVVEPFAAEFPDRFLNAGVAEQNMTGLAAGLAQTGYNVFTYSIANFPTLRCLEQIRNDVCYHAASVKVVSVGAGLAYGALGYSHHAVQDVACLRSLPGMLMATPCDPVETRAATSFLATHRGPAYLRLGKAKEPVIHQQTAPLQTTRLPYPAITPVASNHVAAPVPTAAILACGSVAKLAQEAAAKTGAAVYSPTLWSGDSLTTRAIVELVQSYRRVVVVEEHLMAGGFGSFVRECLEATPFLQSRVRCLSLDSKVCGEVGSQAYLRARGGITVDAIQRALQGPTHEAQDRPALSAVSITLSPTLTMHKS